MEKIINRKQQREECKIPLTEIQASMTQEYSSIQVSDQAGWKIRRRLTLLMFWGHTTNQL